MKEQTTIVVEGPRGEYVWRGTKVPFNDVKKMISEALKAWRKKVRSAKP